MCVYMALCVFISMGSDDGDDGDDASTCVARFADEIPGQRVRVDQGSVRSESGRKSDKRKAATSDECFVLRVNHRLLKHT